MHSECIVSVICVLRRRRCLCSTISVGSVKYWARDSPMQGVTLPANVLHYLIDGGHCAAMQRCFAAIQGLFWTQPGKCRCIESKRENVLRTSTHMLPRE